MEHIECRPMPLSSLFLVQVPRPGDSLTSHLCKASLASACARKGQKTSAVSSVAHNGTKVQVSSKSSACRGFRPYNDGSSINQTWGEVPDIKMANLLLQQCQYLWIGLLNAQSLRDIGKTTLMAEKIGKVECWYKRHAEDIVEFEH